MEVSLCVNFDDLCKGIGSQWVKFHNDRCKGKAIMRQTVFSNPCIVTLTFDLNRAHHWPIGSLCVKFPNDRCKGIAIMRYKTFSVIHAL